MKIDQLEAVELFQELGLHNADKWDSQRLSTKLAKVNQMVDEDTELANKKLSTVLTTILDAIDQEEEIEIVLKKPPTKKTPAKKKKDVVEIVEVEVEEEVEEEMEEDVEEEEVEEVKVEVEKTIPIHKKTVKKQKTRKTTAKQEGKLITDALKKTKKKTTKKTAKKEPNPEPSTNGKVVGVRPMLGRAYYCGQVIKELGLEEGVSQRAIDMVQKRYGGLGGERTTRWQLGHAWHGINGYLGDKGITPTPRED